MNVLTAKKLLLGTLIFLLTACSEPVEKTQKAQSAPESQAVADNSNATTEAIENDELPLKVEGQEKVWRTATVKYFDLEGGFFGLITEDGQRFLPTNLKRDFRQQDAVVKFQGVIKPTTKTIQQWGTPIRIIKMELIKEGIPMDENNKMLY